MSTNDTADLHATFVMPAVTKQDSALSEGDTSLLMSPTEGGQQPPHGTMWGRLISTQGSRFPNISLEEDRVWIGRAAAYSKVTQFSDKRMSSKHCCLYVDKDQAVVVEDHSSNGTYVNNKLIGKGAKVTLRNGDEVSLFSPGTSDDVPCYVFQDKRPGSSPSKLKSSMIASSVGGARKRDRDNDDNDGASEEDRGQAPAKKANTADTADSSTAPANAAAAAAATIPATAAAAAAAAAAEQMGQNLRCGICQEVFYKCVSLVPCMHNFCSGCFSDWMSRSKRCPECRTKVKTVNRNHTIMNMVEAYLLSHPEEKRDEDDLKAQDENNVITTNSMKVPDDGDDDDDDDEDDDDDDSDDDNAGGVYPPFPVPMMPRFQMPGLHMVPTGCRQCPPGDGSGYVCPDANARHLICTACFGKYPERPGFVLKCETCNKAFCHIYWGCKALNAADTIRQLKDFEFTDIPSAVPLGVPANEVELAFKGNQFETDILRNYLRDKNITATDCFRQILPKLDSGEFKCTRRLVTDPKSDKYCCRQCASSIFANLCFNFRSAVPKADLPGAVTARPDCYYGMNCRTQHHNEDHKRKYNHVCPQTRF